MALTLAEKVLPKSSIWEAVRLAPRIIEIVLPASVVDSPILLLLVVESWNPIQYSPGERDPAMGKLKFLPPVRLEKFAVLLAQV